MAIVSVQHLSKQFGSFSAVNDLSFTVEAGDVYGFLGQNGAGKSTTIRMLMTLIAPTAGSIKVFDMPLATHRKEILQQIGAVIEKPDVYKYLSAYDNLRLFARLSGLQLSRKQLMDQLEMVGLAERGYDTVRTFSQGMKQRLGIAIALVHNPQLIVLDEPTNGLDPQGIADIRNLILRLSREWKKTVIVSSHLLSEIEQIATRVLIIDKGKKIVEGSAADLFDPAQTLVELTTTDSSFAWNSLQQSQWAGVLKEQRGAQIILQLHRNDIPELHKALVQMQIGVISLQLKHSLEDYFLQVTAGKQHVDAFSN
ncbi:MAG: ABC transporter ATP-binding protein [Chitinophagaceae bacterium]|nr:ABC transporter ATP-binding protein [Chitinophagaceae bacterium]